MLAEIKANGMSDGLEARIAVVETIIPFVQKALSEHKAATEAFHSESVRARQETNQKIDALAATIAARENQAIGGLFVGRKMAAILLAMAAVSGAAGGKVVAFLAKLL